MEPSDSIPRCSHCDRPLTVDDCWEVATEEGAVLCCSHCRKDTSVESHESPAAAELVHQCYHKLHPWEAAEDAAEVAAWSSEDSTAERLSMELATAESSS
ncbi:MAG: hypothetical protein H8E37_01705 [Planctomycetes bacterium]|nr:hypothetical protein [Planctomycetota bacterium]